MFSPFLRTGGRVRSHHARAPQSGRSGRLTRLCRLPQPPEVHSTAGVCITSWIRQEGTILTAAWSWGESGAILLLDGSSPPPSTALHPRQPSSRPRQTFSDRPATLCSLNNPCCPPRQGFSDRPRTLVGGSTRVVGGSRKGCWGLNKGSRGGNKGSRGGEEGGGGVVEGSERVDGGSTRVPEAVTATARPRLDERRPHGARESSSRRTRRPGAPWASRSASPGRSDSTA